MAHAYTVYKQPAGYYHKLPTHPSKLILTLTHIIKYTGVFSINIKMTISGMHTLGLWSTQKPYINCTL